MPRDNALVCTDCDRIVRVEFGFEGYTGRCDCQRYAFDVVGGDHPKPWERLEDATSGGPFNFYREGHVVDGDVVKSGYILCTVCGDRHGIETSLEAEGLDVFGRDLRVEIRCENAHYSNERALEDEVYLSSGLWRAEIAKDVYIGAERGGR